MLAQHCHLKAKYIMRLYEEVGMNAFYNLVTYTVTISQEHFLHLIYYLWLLCLLVTVHVVCIIVGHYVH